MTAVYGIRNTVTGRVYVGATKQRLVTRWGDHRWKLRHGKGGNAALQADWQTFGEDAFLFGIIERVPQDADLGERELYWMERLRANLGVYNVSTKRAVWTTSDWQPRHMPHWIAWAAEREVYLTFPELLADDEAAVA